MISAVHTLFYSEDPPRTRAFLADVLGWPYVEHSGSGEGWLIFSSGPSETGVHPNQWGTGDSATTVAIHHEISLICDDIEATVAELRAKGAQFDAEPTDMGFGTGVRLRVPAAGSVLLYQPSYRPAYQADSNP